MLGATQGQPQGRGGDSASGLLRVLLAKLWRDRYQSARVLVLKSARYARDLATARALLSGASSVGRHARTRERRGDLARFRHRSACCRAWLAGFLFQPAPNVPYRCPIPRVPAAPARREAD